MSFLEGRDLEKQPEVSEEEQQRLDSIHRDNCSCGRTMTVGYFESFGICSRCVDKAYKKQEKSDAQQGCDNKTTATNIKED